MIRLYLSPIPVCVIILLFLVAGRPTPAWSEHAKPAPSGTDSIILFRSEDRNAPRQIGDTDLAVQIVGRDRRFPRPEGISAANLLQLSRNGHPLALVRIFDDRCSVFPIAIGGIPFIRVESSTVGTGLPFSMLAFVSADGIVLDIFNEQGAVIRDCREIKGRLRVRWTDGKTGTLREALIGPDASILIRDAECGEDVLDWSDLHTIYGTCLGGKPRDDGFSELQFRQLDGRTLTLLSPGTGWLHWLDDRKGSMIRITCGAFRSDMGTRPTQDVAYALAPVLPAPDSRHPDHVLSRRTIAGQYEGWSPEGGNLLQIRTDSGREYILSRDSRISAMLDGKIGHRVSVLCSQNEIWNTAMEGYQPCTVLEALTVDEGPTDRELNETRRLAGSLDAAAAGRLGLWYEQGLHGLSTDPDQALYWYATAVAEGDASAFHSLARCFRKGIGVEADEWAAFEYDQRAAEAGLASGYEAVGDSFMRETIGEGFMLDAAHRRDVAVRWYAMAAGHGQDSAQRKLKHLGRAEAVRSTPPLPVCAQEKLPGILNLSGTWLGESDHHDAFGYLIRKSDGAVVDVIMGNGDVPEFRKIRKGDAVTLQYTREKCLDMYTARCEIFNSYVPESGKITGTGR